MLNVETKFGAFCIWSIIAIICATAAWSAFHWPAPSQIWDDAIQSETALVVERYQTLLGLVLGFGMFTYAYLRHSSLARGAATKQVEERSQNLLAALTAELSDLTVDCGEKAKEAWAFAQHLENSDKTNARDAGLPEGLFKSIASPLDTALMDLAPNQLAPLGGHIYSHIRRLRQELRYIEDVIDQVPDEDTVLPADQSAFFKELAKGYLTMSQACAHVKSVCEGKHNGGTHNSCCDHHHPVEALTQHALEDLRA